MTGISRIPALMLRKTSIPPPKADLESADCASGGTQILFGGLLLAVTWLAYLPALHGGMLWDDLAHVTAPALRSLHGLGRIWFELGATQQYYPTLHTAFWLEHRLWGDAVIGYHVVNVTLHVGAAWLFYAVLRELKMPAAWIAALLFALHPVGVESVAWISEQKNTLSLGFYLAAALAYLKFDRRRTPGRYLLASGFFLVALSTKSVTATLPAALLVVIWWRRGRLVWNKDWLPLLPWLVVGASAGLFTAWVERTVIGANGADYNLTFGMRVVLAGRALAFYLGKLLWPANLSFIYPHWTIDPAVWWQDLFPLGCLMALGFLFLRLPRRRGLLAALLCFSGTLFPVLGFFNLYPFAYSYVADHFQYHASLGIFALVAAGWSAWRDHERSQPLRWRQTAPTVAALAILAGLAVQTFRQCRNYSDVETLYRATLERNPDCILAHNNLGMLLARRGDSAAAIAHFRRALAANPNYAEAEDNLGGEYAKLAGHELDAVSHFEAALRLRPDFLMAHVNLANELALLPGRWPEAEQHYLRALELKPDYAKAHNDLAIGLAQFPARRTEALAHYEAALRIDPNYAGARANYAFELSRDPGRRREALDQYAAALAADPAQAEAENNLANLLAGIPGRQAEAITHYEAALRLRPDYAEAHNNLANELVKDPNRVTQALAHYEAAVRIKPDYAEAHNNLAISYANEGRIDDAARHFRLAIKIRPDFQAARDNLTRLLAPNP